ncbi:MAG: homocysteine S-methyltransferase family protein [Gammaproteobacteria bacterium]|nr:homocysteine S-methyltransferase family protein [Gammaproteobacteria bacterium]
MNLHELLNSNQLILADGSMYELLRRSPEVEFDEYIAHGGLIYNPGWAGVLERVFREYIDVAVAQARPMLTTTATWRANRERIDRSSFAGKAVNRDNALFLRRIVDSYGDANPGLLIGGTIGPKGDAYKPEQALTSAAARDFHAYQIDDLVAGGVDFLQAATFPALSEAIGVAQLMAQSGLPYTISFVIEKSGCLLDGTMLDEAIRRIDERVAEALPCYAVNCVHPSVLQQALALNPLAAERIVAFSGNTSARSVEELDGLEELDVEEPESFALANKTLLQAHGIRVIGGCCGTNPEHIRAIARLI